MKRVSKRNSISTLYCFVSIAHKQSLCKSIPRRHHISDIFSWRPIFKLQHHWLSFFCSQATYYQMLTCLSLQELIQLIMQIIMKSWSYFIAMFVLQLFIENWRHAVHLTQQSGISALRNMLWQHRGFWMKHSVDFSSSPPQAHPTAQLRQLFCIWGQLMVKQSYSKLK